jgi:hypothetical protein
VDPHEVAAVVKNSAASLAEAESDIGEQALALGLATGQFSRSLTPSTMASCPADTAPRSAGHQGRAFARLRAAGKRALGSVVQATRTAAVTPAAPSHADSGASDIDESVTTAASHACDPRVPFESSSSFLVVDLPPSFVPLSTIVIVRFEVEDNGCGISDEHIAQLFKPYSQVRRGVAWVVSLHMHCALSACCSPCRSATAMVDTSTAAQALAFTYL